MNVNKFKFNEKICLRIDRYNFIITFFPTQEERIKRTFQCKLHAGYIFIFDIMHRGQRFLLP